MHPVLVHSVHGQSDPAREVGEGDVPGAASRLGAFLEYGGGFISGTRPFHQLDTGCTWIPRPDTQLDPSVGFGLSPAAPDSFVGLGISRRF